MASWLVRPPDIQMVHSLLVYQSGFAVDLQMSHLLLVLESGFVAVVVSGVWLLRCFSCRSVISSEFSTGSHLRLALVSCRIHFGYVAPVSLVPAVAALVYSALFKIGTVSYQNLCCQPTAA